MPVAYKTIKGGNITLPQYLRQFWQSRALLMVFARRDLRIQYAQTFLGILWSLVQPLTGLLIYTFFFQRLITIPVNAPYAVFAFTGIMGWHYFSALVGQAGTSLMHNRDIIKKINFPRVVLPVSKVFTLLAEFAMWLLLLVVLMLLTGCPFSWKIIFLPLVLAANSVVGLSAGIWLSALTIRFRDFHHIIPYLIGFGIWLTPVFYPTTLIPENYNWVYYFHPVANVIALYRWMFIGGDVHLLQTAVSFLLVAVVFYTGLINFIRNEKIVADYL